MKELVAFIRPVRARLTKEKLAEKGFVSYTETRVSGRGKQRGLRYQPDDSASGIPFLPKRMMTIFVNDEEVVQAVSVLVEANRSGEIGDGKIFVCPAEEAYRIRTDEKSRAALG